MIFNFPLKKAVCIVPSLARLKSKWRNSQIHMYYGPAYVHIFHLNLAVEMSNMEMALTVPVLVYINALQIQI